MEPEDALQYKNSFKHRVPRSEESEGEEAELLNPKSGHGEASRRVRKSPEALQNAQTSDLI